MRSMYLLLLILTSTICWSQNLILNPSFEDVSSCPTDIEQLFKAKHWKNVGGSVDLFGECSVKIIPDPPQGPINYAKFEFGKVYSHSKISFPFRLRSDTIFREFMQGELLQPLSAGLYYFSCYIYTNEPNRTNHLGLHFSNEDLGFIGSYPKGIIPQYEFDEWIGGYNKWKKFEACINNIEGANYITIGNFHEPGMDSIEYPDIKFSNGVFIDNLLLVKILVSEFQDSTIYKCQDECIVLDSTVSNIPVEYFYESIKLDKYQLCSPENKKLEQRVKKCGTLLRNIYITSVDCNCTPRIPNIISKFSFIPENSKFLVKFAFPGIVDNINLLIFNRWGNLIYSGKPEDFNSDVMSGVYVYVLSYYCNNVKKLIAGDITIIE